MPIGIDGPSRSRGRVTLCRRRGVFRAGDAVGFRAFGAVLLCGQHRRDRHLCRIRQHDTSRRDGNLNAGLQWLVDSEVDRHAVVRAQLADANRQCVVNENVQIGACRVGDSDGGGIPGLARIERAVRRLLVDGADDVFPGRHGADLIATGGVGHRQPDERGVSRVDGLNRRLGNRPRLHPIERDAAHDRFWNRWTGAELEFVSVRTGLAAKIGNARQNCDGVCRVGSPAVVRADRHAGAFPLHARLTVPW